MTDGFDVRLRDSARRGIRDRLLLVVWSLGVLPVVLVLVSFALGFGARALFNGLGIGLMYVVLYGGQAWKNPGRVRALLDEGEGEELVSAFPVGLPDQALLSRLLGGSGGFLVVSNRRVLVFSRNRITDVATELLWSAPRRDCSAELRSDGSALTITGGGESRTWRLGPGARRRAAVERFVVAINRGWW
ncbi:hypothetical protein ACIBKX_11915 [Streptomyces sp. NPDC050658]|uniref:hypothetical protein n=1 Tax=unclassified Streptomyces TaxID=2593676 RepID=UPI00343DC348